MSTARLHVTTLADGLERVSAKRVRYDSTVSLVYLNNRYHDPTLGSFISVDPLVTATGEAHIYGSANPITLSDPTGLCTTSMYIDGTCSPSAVIWDDLSSGDHLSVEPTDDAFGSRTQPFTDEILTGADRSGVNWKLLAAVLEWEAGSVDNGTGTRSGDTILDVIKMTLRGGTTTLGVGQVNLGAVQDTFERFPQLAMFCGCTTELSSTGYAYEPLELDARRMWAHQAHDDEFAVTVSAFHLRLLEEESRAMLDARGFQTVLDPASAPANALVVPLSQLVATLYNVSAAGIFPAFQGGTLNLSRATASAQSRWSVYGGLATTRFHAVPS